MARELKILKLEPVIVEPDRIGLNVEGALTDSEDNVSLAVPNVTFEVRIGIVKVYSGTSDASTGIFVAKNILLDENIDRYDVVISANDGVSGFILRAPVDIKVIRTEIKGRREKAMEQSAELAAREPKAAALATLDEAEKQRGLKESIKVALGKVIEEYYYLTNEQGGVESAFEIIMANMNHPIVGRRMLELAENHAVRLVKYIGCYARAPWAKEVVICLAKKLPDEVIRNIGVFYKFPWALEVLMFIAENNSEIAFRLIEKYEYQPWAREVAMEAAEGDPEAAMKYFNLYQDQPWAGEVKGFAEAEKERRKLEAERKKRDEEEGKRLEAERRQREEQEQKELEERARWTEEALMRLASTDPYKAVDNFHKYADQPWAKEVLLVAAQTGHWSLIQSFEKYRDKPYAREILTKAAEVSPYEALTRSRSYRSKGWGKAVFLNAVRELPHVALENVWERWEDEIIEIAIEDGIRKLEGDLGRTDNRLSNNYLFSFFSKNGTSRLARKVAEVIYRKYPHIAERYDNYLGGHAKHLKRKDDEDDPFFHVKKFFRDLFG